MAGIHKHVATANFEVVAVCDLKPDRAQRAFNHVKTKTGKEPASNMFPGGT